jgi:tetratricopeptide (TPR) repeat protein
LPVNKEEVIKNKVVPVEWEDQIAERMAWTYNKGAVTKGDLAMFDILVHNNWERPIYFAVTVPTENFMGLDNYLYTEGFAYRLMPIKQEHSDPETMVDKVNPYAMYTNTLDKFVWGNIKESKYLDHESYGMINVIINNFTTLANSLLAQGKTEEARAVMNRADEVIPERIYTQRQALQKYLMGELLYKVGETEKANKIFSANLKYIEEYLNYYFAIAQTKANLERENMQVGMYTLHGMEEVTSEFNQAELNEKIKTTFSSLERRYSETFQQ